jgi:hypothetical protein
LAPTPTNRVYDRNFPYAWIPLILNNNSPQFRSNRRQKIFSKKPRTPPFYQICTPKKHLNGHSSLIKHNMTMNSTPLDSSFQCASLSRKNFTSLFSFNRNSKKTKKIIFLAPTPTNRVFDRNFPYAWIPLILNIAPLLNIIWQWILHRWILLFNALLLSRKNFTSLFSFKRNSQKTKKIIFLAPTPTNRVYDRNFPYAWIPLILNNNSPQFRSNRRQKNFSKKPRTPPFYQICTPKKHLNGHSSLIKHNMTMNSTPLDSSFQCASFEPKKFYLAFFV